MSAEPGEGCKKTAQARPYGQAATSRSRGLAAKRPYGRSATSRSRGLAVKRPDGQAATSRSSGLTAKQHLTVPRPSGQAALRPSSDLTVPRPSGQAASRPSDLTVMRPSGRQTLSAWVWYTRPWTQASSTSSCRTAGAGNRPRPSTSAYGMSSTSCPSTLRAEPGRVKGRRRLQTRLSEQHGRTSAARASASSAGRRESVEPATTHSPLALSARAARASRRCAGSNSRHGAVRRCAGSTGWIDPPSALRYDVPGSSLVTLPSVDELHTAVLSTSTRSARTYAEWPITRFSSGPRQLTGLARALLGRQSLPSYDKAALMRNSVSFSY